MHDVLAVGLDQAADRGREEVRAATGRRRRRRRRPRSRGRPRARCARAGRPAWRLRALGRANPTGDDRAALAIRIARWWRRTPFRANRAPASGSNRAQGTPEASRTGKRTARSSRDQRSAGMPSALSVASDSPSNVWASLASHTTPASTNSCCSALALQLPPMPEGPTLPDRVVPVGAWLLRVIRDRRRMTQAGSRPVPVDEGDLVAAAPQPKRRPSPHHAGPNDDHSHAPIVPTPGSEREWRTGPAGDRRRHS